MGLLEKAQERKKEISKPTESKEEKVDAKKEVKGLLAKAQQRKKIAKKSDEKEESKLTAETKKGLLEKAKKRKELLESKEKEEKSETKTEEKPKVQFKLKNQKSEKSETIEEKKGFGWKGLGTRRIIYDNVINEYVYELDEPVLSDYEKEVKKELTRLFKMLADVNIAGIDKEEKVEFLEKTLENIVKDNNIDFIEKQKKLDIGLFSKKSKDEKENNDENKDKKKMSFLKKSTKTKEPKEEKQPEEKLTKEERAEKEQEIKDRVYYHLFREFLGYGRIDIIMEDEGIEDVSCDGFHVPIFIYHKKYDAIISNVQFEEEKELNSFVVRLAQVCGKQISIFSPIVDGKLPDGSRLQTTLGRTVTRGATFTIRKFKENPLTPIDLIEFESISAEMAAYFWMAIEKGASILFCGGTASGKTTALNALSLFIPSQNKIVTIEDTREINLPHKNWIAGTTRQGFSASDEKTGKDIDMFDLIRAALRQRPKVVMVGEVRGKEAYSLFQAMATGHTSYATVHASDIHTLIQRLENPPISLPRALLTSLDIIVFQNAIDIKGKTVRRMTSVTEVVKLDPDTNQLIFMEPFKWVSKTEDRFDSSGTSKALNDIRLQNDWSEEKISKELINRAKVLQWMQKKDIRDYKEVGRIVNLYSKYPEEILEQVKEDMKN